ncbi:histidine phosphatase family protein [Oceaniserpentilla sp. 4NH20-0058]|uniref:histidine phosphatase family protein n=1 Tax=Oceaniserpentilla sp. 4NH20-0058 TaxID=3127660 RepID=UPI0031028E11
MADIFLIRHGQASFGKENYDALSDLGKQQAVVLGRSLASTIKPTQLICGTLNRQQQTLEGLVTGYEQVTGSSLELPVQIKPEFNELDHTNILTVHDERFADPEYMKREILTQPEANKVFHKIYTQAIFNWFEGKDGDYTESFDEFYQRVTGAVNNIISNAQSKERIVVVSSAGSISMCLQDVLGVSAKKAFELNEVMANTAVNRFVFNGSGKLNLSYYNNFHHLPMADVKVTYR